MDDRRLRVCLERTVELAEVRLGLRDWPGFGGPIVHVPDPLSPDDGLAQALAATLAPRYRVLSLKPRGASPYQVDAADLLAVLDQFGFESPILAGEGLGCVAALLVAAWYPDRVAGLVLIDATCDPPPVLVDARSDPPPVLVDARSDPPPPFGIEARALRDCPPDWTSLRQAARCPVLDLVGGASTVEDLAAFAIQLAPVDVT